MAKLLRNIKRVVFSRLVITAVLVAAQACFLFSTFYRLSIVRKNEMTGI